jgi:hypothetical protein
MAKKEQPTNPGGGRFPTLSGNEKDPSTLFDFTPPELADAGTAHGALTHTRFVFEDGIIEAQRTLTGAVPAPMVKWDRAYVASALGALIIYGCARQANGADLALPNAKPETPNYNIEAEFFGRATVLSKALGGPSINQLSELLSPVVTQLLLDNGADILDGLRASAERAALEFSGATVFTHASGEQGLPADVHDAATAVADDALGLVGDMHSMLGLVRWELARKHAFATLGIEPNAPILGWFKTQLKKNP